MTSFVPASGTELKTVRRFDNSKGGYALILNVRIHKQATQSTKLNTKPLNNKEGKNWCLIYITAGELLNRMKEPPSILKKQQGHPQLQLR